MATNVIYIAGPWEQGSIDSLRQKFEEILGKKLDIQVKEDPALIGGFLARIEGRVYDSSMRHALETSKGADDPSQSAIDKNSIRTYLDERVTALKKDPAMYDYGTVTQAGDGVVWLDGLSHSRYGELLELDGVYAMALNLSATGVGAVLLDSSDVVHTGSLVKGTGSVIDVPVGDELLGRVIDPVGRPLDGLPLKARKRMPVEREAPHIIDRQGVKMPLMTGILAIDSMIPIGRGQRELIIGDRQTGKTAIAVDAMLNQKDVICVYAAIGQKASTVAQVIQRLTDGGAMSHTVVVAATAADAPAMQYLAPYAACTVAEEFMHQGKHVLVIYDDLSKHAVAYRTMSLLLKRPTGREAYPGDVFYLHSRLLERAAQLKAELGGGSITALPIVETMAGDISAYIPTNVISITDGQIYLETDLFKSGMRPAINVGLSVSRVGRAAQSPAMRRVCGTLRLELAQYRELAVFSRFSSDVDHATKKRLDRGERLAELLKQPQSRPLSLAEQTSLLLAYNKGIFDAVPTADITKAKEKLLQELLMSRGDVMSSIDKTGCLEDEEADQLEQTMGKLAEEK